MSQWESKDAHGKRAGRSEILKGIPVSEWKQKRNNAKS